MSIRTYSQMWMFPWAHTTVRPENYQVLSDVAEYAVRFLNNYTGSE